MKLRRCCGVPAHSVCVCVCVGGDATGLQRTGQYVSDLFQSGALTCLICIASVKRTQAVRHVHTNFDLLLCVDSVSVISASLI